MLVNKVEICGVNTSTLTVLPEEEMVRLLKMIQNGDEEARETFIKGNLRLVLSVIQRFNNRKENVDDLFQVGCIGLIKAIDNFDLGQNVKFSTYAVPMVIGEIRRYLRDNNPIRVSRSLRDLAYRALTVRTEYVTKHGKEPTVEEIAQELELPVPDVVYAMEAIQDPVSMFEPVYHGGGETMLYVMDQISDTKADDGNWLENIALEEAMQRLNDREKNILYLRFFRGRTQMEVAEEIGISQAQVSRMEKNALSNMKKHFNPIFPYTKEYVQMRKRPKKALSFCPHPNDGRPSTIYQVSQYSIGGQEGISMDRFCDIRDKKVINIFDGRCIGHVFDLVIDCVTGTICAIIVPGCGRLRSYFLGGEDIIIPWNKVIKIGEDVILVELDNCPT